MGAASVPVAVLFSLQHAPEAAQRLPGLVAIMAGTAVVLALSLDNLRCTGRANRLLGGLYLALAACFVLYVLWRW